VPGHAACQIILRMFLDSVRHRKLRMNEDAEPPRSRDGRAHRLAGAYLKGIGTEPRAGSIRKRWLWRQSGANPSPVGFLAIAGRHTAEPLQTANLGSRTVDCRQVAPRAPGHASHRHLDVACAAGVGPRSRPAPL
jgi:hypothetical protein